MFEFTEISGHILPDFAIRDDMEAYFVAGNEITQATGTAERAVKTMEKDRGAFMKFCLETVTLLRFPEKS